MRRGVVAGLVAAAVVRVGVPRALVDPIWLQVVPVAGPRSPTGWRYGCTEAGSLPPSSEAPSSVGCAGRSAAR